MKKIIPIFILGLIFLTAFILANNNCVPNPITNEFYGVVHAGGSPLTGGDYILIATINGEIVGAQEISSDGSYSIDVSPCPGVDSGEIEFFVGNEKADESGDYEYNNSAPILIELNLTLDKDPISVCGNGELKKGGGEECDDGNIDSGDGCSDICEIELGYSCEWDSNLGSVCTLLPYCGDGTCDNDESCSSCSSDCGACPTNPSGGGSSGGTKSSGSGGSTTISSSTNNSTNIVNQSKEDLSGVGLSTLNGETQKTEEKQTKSIVGRAISNLTESKTGKGVFILIFIGVVFGAFVLMKGKNEKAADKKKSSKKNSGKKTNAIKVVKIGDLAKRKK